MSSLFSARGACPFLCPWSAFYLFSTAHVRQNCTLYRVQSPRRCETITQLNLKTATGLGYTN